MTEQQSVEMILVRQLAGYLLVPVVVVDTAGTVVFYNEPAERILGVRFEETGRISAEEADRLIELSDAPAANPDEPKRPIIAQLDEPVGLFGADASRLLEAHPENSLCGLVVEHDRSGRIDDDHRHEKVSGELANEDHLDGLLLGHDGPPSSDR